MNEVFYPKPELPELTFQIIKNHTSILTTLIFIINNLSLLFLLIEMQYPHLSFICSLPTSVVFLRQTFHELQSIQINFQSAILYHQLY